jgi:hypothetical protein
MSALTLNEVTTPVNTSAPSYRAGPLGIDVPGLDINLTVSGETTGWMESLFPDFEDEP